MTADLLSIAIAASAFATPIILADFIGAIRFARRMRPEAISRSVLRPQVSKRRSER
jgi:hypothetical protein